MLEIRPARNGDEAKIADVIVTAWKAAYRDILPDSLLDSLTTERHETIIRANLANGTETIHVLASGADIVGVVSGRAQPAAEHQCQLVAIYILPEHQKSGWGRRLLSAMTSHFHDSGLRSMILWTFADNRDRGFYRKLGGVVREEKTQTFGGTEKRLVGYVWDDIGTIGPRAG